MENLILKENIIKELQSFNSTLNDITLNSNKNLVDINLNKHIQSLKNILKSYKVEGLNV